MKKAITYILAVALVLGFTYIHNEDVQSADPTIGGHSTPVGEEV